MAKKKYIETPEKMWELFQAYKKEVKDNPRIKVEYVGRDGETKKTPIERPLTIEGFKTYCAYEVGSIQHYWINYEDNYSEYQPIIMRIREEIRAEQIDGAMTSFYNSNLTARLNNLKEQTENNTTITEVPLFPDVSEDDSDK